MVHLYYGDGKGKTTAAMGLALRAVGHGQRVLVCRFLKNNESGEIKALVSLPGVTLADCGCVYGFIPQMSPAERERVAREQQASFEEICREISEQQYDLVVLDEVLWLTEFGIISVECLKKLISENSNERELVLTGGKACRELIELADYVTCMNKVSHPFDKGAPSRPGVEF